MAMSVRVGLCVNVRSTLITGTSYGTYILEYVRQCVSLYGCVNVCVGVILVHDYMFGFLLVSVFASV